MAYDFGAYSNVLGAQRINPADFGDLSSTTNMKFRY